jgi:CYTH domain-containing protein
MDEFELTYLVKYFPANFEKSLKKELLDIYIPSSSDHPSLRIRKSGEKYEITKKEPAKEGDASHQIEMTITLTPAEHKELAELKGKRIEKTRYYYHHNGFIFEVDVFGGDLQGLVLADVEFGSAEKKLKFEMPSWFLVEVTQEKFLAGGMLCGKRYSDIENDLKRFDYKKLKMPL